MPKKPGKAYHIQVPSQKIVEGNQEYSWWHKKLEKYKPYTIKQEREALLIIKGISIVDKKTHKTRKPTPEERLAAEQDFIMCNMRLVMFIILGLSHKQHYDPIIMDLITYGIEGLYTALSKFKISKGTKFSTYATTWIKQKITRKLLQITSDATIKKGSLKKQYDSVARVFKATFGCALSENDIFKILNWTEEDIMKFVLKDKPSMKVSIDEETNERGADAVTVIPLLTELDPNLIEDDSPVAALEWKETVDNLYACMHRLSDLERLVLELRYGINYNFNPMTQHDIAKVLPNDREFLMKMERRALKKLWLLMRKHGESHDE